MNVQFETTDPDGDLLCIVHDMAVPRVGDEVYIQPLTPRRWVVVRVVWNVFETKRPEVLCDAVSVICAPKEDAA